MATQSSLRGSTGMSAPFPNAHSTRSFPTKAPFSDRSNLALIPLHLSGSKWCITPDRAVQLDGAHGSEIVRSICFPNQVSFFLTEMLSPSSIITNLKPAKDLFDPPFPSLDIYPREGN